MTLPTTGTSLLTPPREGSATPSRLRGMMLDPASAQIVLDRITDAFYVLDRQFRFTYVNQGALDYYGRGREELLGRVLWDVFPITRGTRFQREYERALAEDRTVEFEALSPLTHKWVEVHVYPTPDGLAVYFRDITARKRAEEALEESEERYRQLIARAPDGVLVTDAQGRYIDANERACALLGRERGEVLGRSASDFLAPEEHERLATARASFAVEGSQRSEWIMRRRDGSDVPVEISAARLPDGRQVAFLRDISERRLVYARLRTLAAVVERSNEFIGISTPTLEPLYLNEAGRRMVGLDAEEVSRTRVLDYFMPEEVSRIERQALPALLRDGQWSDEVRFRHFRTGEPIPTLWSAIAIRDESDRIVALATVSPDLRPLKAAESRLREREAQLRALSEALRARTRELAERERRLRAMLDAQPECVKVVSPEGVLLEMNPAGLAMIEADSIDQVRGLDVLDLVAPERHAPFRDLHEAALAGKPIEQGREFEIVGLKGTRRWMESRSVPLRSDNGEVASVLSVTRDVTDRKRSEAQRELLIHELNHRVKNTLAIVQSLASQTLRSSGSLDVFGASFTGRITSLAAAHDLLVQGQWTSVDLATLLERSLGPARDRVLLEGPRVELSASAAVSLSMLFHELATNAAKYGALSRADGRVTIRWSIEGPAGERLHAEWREQGGPPVVPPARRSFGSRLIQQVARELGGQVEKQWAPEGLICELRMPLAPSMPAPTLHSAPEEVR